MNLTYIANIRFPTEKAHGLQIAKMCEAFAKNALSVNLIVSKRKNSISEDIFSYYKVENIFSVKKIWSLDTVSWGKIGFFIQYISFTISVLVQIFFNNKKDTVYYSRDELVVLALKLLGKKVVWEAHRGDMNVATKYITRTCPVVTITQGLALAYKLNQYNNYMVAADGVDPKEFDVEMSIQEARQKVGFADIQGPVVLYSGHLYSWKGADTLAQVAHLISEATFVFVGGTEADIAKFKEKYAAQQNIVIVGHVPHEEVVYYLKAADILVLPNSAKTDISRLYTSPLKLFEYMMSKRVIIASLIPSLMEVIHESNAYTFAADDSDDLADKIHYVLAHRDEAEQKVKQAYNDVQRYTWIERAKNISEFIK
jgi:glycosyltransferase involved in cell wall biosynthesis